MALIDIDPQSSLTNWYKIRQRNLGKNNTKISFAATSEWQMLEFVEEFKKQHDFIIIDTHSQSALDTKTAIRMADLVLIPLQPSPTDLWVTEKTIDVIKEERIPHRLILNRMVNNAKISKQIEAKFTDLIAAKISNRIAFIESMEKGLTSCEIAYGTAAINEITALSSAIDELLNPLLSDEKEEKNEHEELILL